jgi:hypothetical protein
MWGVFWATAATARNTESQTRLILIRSSRQRPAAPCTAGSSATTFSGTATLSLSSREPVPFSIFSSFLHIQPAVFQTPQNRHPERSASQNYRKQRALWREVEGPRRCLLAYALGSFLAAKLHRKIRKSQTLSEAEGFADPRTFRGNVAPARSGFIGYTPATKLTGAIGALREVAVQLNEVVGSPTQLLDAGATTTSRRDADHATNLTERGALRQSAA